MLTACRFLLLSALGLFLVLLVAIAGFRGSIVAASTFIVFCSPGIFLGVRLFGRGSWRRPESWIIGSVLGLVLSEFVVLMVAYCGGWRIGNLIIAIVALNVLAFLFSHGGSVRCLGAPSPEWNHHDYSILGGATLTFLLFATIPFLNFGRLTGFGYAYTWLFGFDFILRGSYVTSLTLGMPPDFLHLAGNTFRYYLVSYVEPAFAYSLTNKTVPQLSLLLAYTLLVDALFVGCLFMALRHFVRSQRALMWTMLVGMVAYSYYGWYVLVHVALNNYLKSTKYLNGYESALSYNDVSHLFQRLMLVEPQAITGLCLLLCILYLLEVSEYRMIRYDLSVVLGISLGIGFGIDALLGLLTAVWFGITCLVRWLRHRALFRSEFYCVALCVALCTAIYLGYFAVGMYSFSDRGQMHIETYWWLLRLAPIYFVVDFGPMVILGLSGLWKIISERHPRYSFEFVLLAILILLQTVFLRVGVLPRERLAERVLPIVLLIWTGLFFEIVVVGNDRKWVKRLVGLLVLAAVPTYFTDVCFTSSIHNVERTSYVTAADMRACQWIRRNVAETAIVQSEPNYFGKLGLPEQRVYPISLIPDFAERREILGEWYVAGTTIMNSKVVEQVRAHDVREMFSAREIAQVQRIASKYAIDYIYVGPCEQNKYPEILRVLLSEPKEFQQVYSEGAVHIFERTSGFDARALP